MRPLLHFFALGALLFLARHALGKVAGSDALPTLHVVIKQSASEAECERAIDEALLVEQALRGYGALVDPVVREQLLSSMRARERSVSATEQPESDALLLKRALALGLHRADAVTRQRLIFQAEQLLMASASSAVVSDAQLTRYLSSHVGRYARERRSAFTQVSLRRDRHAAALHEDASRLLVQLQRGVPASEACALADPTLLPCRVASSADRALDARFGAAFSSALGALPLGVWSGPVASAYGEHLVLLHERTLETAATLSALSARERERVLADYRHDHRQEVLRARLRSLRARYRVEVRRLRS